MRRNHPLILAVLITAVTTLTACGSSDSSSTTHAIASELSTTDATTSTTTDATRSTTDAGTSATTSTTAPVIAAAGCDWESERLSSEASDDAPSGEGTDFATAILGSWQHTHINEGSGFEPLKSTTDIRFVLTSDRFLYCQDVDGATDKSEISAPLQLEGTDLVLPSPATGYAVTAWDENTMVWLNHRDGTLYLLKRR